jgi:hypothetical protein
MLLSKKSKTFLNLNKFYFEKLSNVSFLSEKIQNKISDFPVKSEVFEIKKNFFKFSNYKNKMFEKINKNKILSFSFDNFLSYFKNKITRKEKKNINYIDIKDKNFVHYNDILDSFIPITLHKKSFAESIFDDEKSVISSIVYKKNLNLDKILKQKQTNDETVHRINKQSENFNKTEIRRPTKNLPGYSSSKKENLKNFLTKTEVEEIVKSYIRSVNFNEISNIAVSRLRNNIILEKQRNGIIY